jgi:hypothetical protein
MASTACFVIVSKNDIPIYEAEVGSAPKVSTLDFIFLPILKLHLSYGYIYNTFSPQHQPVHFVNMIYCYVKEN